MKRLELRQDIRRCALHLHLDRAVFHIAHPAGERARLCEVGVGKAKANAPDLSRPTQELAQGSVLGGLVACEHGKPAAQLELDVRWFLRFSTAAGDAGEERIEEAHR